MNATQTFEPALPENTGYRAPSQLTMTGEDWLSERDKKQTARVTTTRKKAGLVCMAKLEAAAEALRDYLRACNACNDGSGDGERGHGDGRRIMVANLAEYASYLSMKYDR